VFKRKAAGLQDKIILPEKKDRGKDKNEPVREFERPKEKKP
jgi:hypothetical protein